jgi:hypothetical protein
VTHSEAQQHIKRLKRIAELKITDMFTWLALVDDELQSAMPNSRLLERFEQVKSDGEKELRATDGADGRSQTTEQVRAQCQDLILVACERLESDPLPKEDLSEEIDRIIQKGYFKSIYFRAVLGGLALVLVLVTGIEGYRLSEQVKAMQKMVDEARQQVEQSRVEVAKSESETQANEGKLALILLEGDQKMVEMRTKALSQIDEEGFADRTKIADRGKYWTNEFDARAVTAGQEIDKVAKESQKKIGDETTQAAKDFEGSVSQSKQQLTDKLTSALESLQAQQTPWILRILWSFSKSWILAPLAAIVALMGLFTSLSTLANADAQWIKGSKWVKSVAIANTALLLGMGAAFVGFCFRG